jgi:hypothetical protein
MRRRTRIHALALAVAICAPLLAGSLTAPATARPLASVRSSTPSQRVQIGHDAWQLFLATNASRGRFGVPKLQLNRAMSKVARLTPRACASGHVAASHCWNAASAASPARTPAAMQAHQVLSTLTRGRRRPKSRP